MYWASLPPMRTPRLPLVNRTYAPADLNGPVCFAKRRNLVFVCVPSHFKRSLVLVVGVPCDRTSVWAPEAMFGRADSTGMRKGKWLFMNGCECKKPDFYCCGMFKKVLPRWDMHCCVWGLCLESNETQVT